MANISFNKLNCKINSDVKKLTWGDCEIEVKQYLPIQEKLKLIEEVINNSITQYNYANPVQVKVFTDINLIKFYTNVKFTDKQLSEPAKLFDMVTSSGLLAALMELIPEADKEFLNVSIEKSIHAFYGYRTSLLGILDVLKLDYSDLNAQLVGILGQIKDPEALTLIKELNRLSGSSPVNTEE